MIMSYRYFDDLSGDSSDGGDESQSDEEGCFALGVTSTRRTTKRKDQCGGVELHDDADDECHPINNLDARCIVHADVDCFYCQCETLDRNLDPARPLAIGQKHIIVTCNYAAREAGLTKLMLREEAYRRCPHLLLVEGSDLERYRIHGRKIYESFRRACQQLRPNSPVAKGSMDEMVADLTCTTSSADTTQTGNACDSDGIYIYGCSENDTSHAIIMTEDQSGAQTVVVHHTSHGRSEAPGHDDTVVLHRLRETATLALRIRETVLSETGFTITLGISTNVLLAKIASGLKKPGKVNILPPGPGSQLLIENMPLRKIPGIGSRTMKVLIPCLTLRNGERDKMTPWTCGDLLRVHQADVTRCLEGMNNGEKTSAEQCSIIFDLCRGRDESPVVDDEGGLQKTLSVENSFKRGSVTTKEKTMEVIEDLYHRLPRLLKNRIEWSSEREKAFPTSIRLTVRSVDPERKGKKLRRPFSTKSKQTSIDGTLLLSNADAVEKQASLLRQSILPLLNSLVFASPGNIDITRINVALTGFQDVASASPKTMKTLLSQKHHRLSKPATATRPKTSSLELTARTAQSKIQQSEDGFDVDVLNALPPDIAAEVRSGLHSSRLPATTKRTRIDQFFISRKKP